MQHLDTKKKKNGNSNYVLHNQCIRFEYYVWKYPRYPNDYCRLSACDSILCNFFAISEDARDFSICLCEFHWLFIGEILWSLSSFLFFLYLTTVSTDRTCVKLELWSSQKWTFLRKNFETWRASLGCSIRFRILIWVFRLLFITVWQLTINN